MGYLSNKEIAAEMQLSERSFRRWRRKLRKRVKPTVDTHSGQRWSRRDADKFLKAWETFGKKKRKRR